MLKTISWSLSFSLFVFLYQAEEYIINLENVEFDCFEETLFIFKMYLYLCFAHRLISFSLLCCLSYFVV